MWPFKKKKLESEPMVESTPEPDWRNKGIADLKAFRDIGETFQYLGRTCVVTSHTTYVYGYGYCAQLHFDYCDNIGVLHSMCSDVSELPALIKQQDL